MVYIKIVIIEERGARVEHRAWTGRTPYLVMYIRITAYNLRRTVRLEIGGVGGAAARRCRWNGRLEATNLFPIEERRAWISGMLSSKPCTWPPQFQDRSSRYYLLFLPVKLILLLPIPDTRVPFPHRPQCRYFSDLARWNRARRRGRQRERERG